jgi:hypothetical protein
MTLFKRQTADLDPAPVATSGHLTHSWREGVHESWEKADRQSMHRLPVKSPVAGWHGLKVVGETHDDRQTILETLAGGKTEEACSIRVLAELRPEPENPFDPNAVAVLVEGNQVAYLARADAAKMSKTIQELGADGKPVTCAALIRGGWKRPGGDEGNFGVTLLIDQDGFLANPHGV